jgi:iron complex outermembrane receptor protein
MSELIQKQDNRATIRWKLLTGASAMALTAYVSSVSMAGAEDASRPQVWIELGGQLSKLQDSQETFKAPFEADRPSIFSPSQKFEKSPLFGFDEYGKISFQPDNSDWVFSAAIRYGRATANRHIRQQTFPGKLRFNFYATLTSNPRYYTKYPHAAKFADTESRNSEQHAILDFQAGKDVGLGLFGKNSSSVVKFGVRFAQFTDKSNISLKSDPDWRFKMKYYSYYGIRLQVVVQPYHTNAAGLVAYRSFNGVGPSLSWNSSVPFAGNGQDGELDFDWSVTAALLFGRQKVRTQHHTTERYQTGGDFSNILAVSLGDIVLISHNAPPPRTRSRNVTVPNVGGSVGLSWSLQNFKMSFGYKADFFFGAMDGGIDARKSENRAFYGPYASISIGFRNGP